MKGEAGRWRYRRLSDRDAPKVLLGAAAVTVLMLLFPPFYAYVNRQLMSLGYGFILLPPWREFGERDATPAFVNVGLLFAQWFAVWIVAAVLYFEAALGSAVESGLSICFRHAHYVALLGQEAPP